MQNDRPDHLIWEEKINKYFDIFNLVSVSKYFVNELSKINDCKTLLKTKVSIAIIGPDKSGKSTFLNTLMRKEYLHCNLLNCTSFGLKIIASDKNDIPKLYQLDKKSQTEITDDINIKNKIEKINIAEQELRKNELIEKKKFHTPPIWVLETPIFAFRREFTFYNLKSSYFFLELIDLPGINPQNCLFGVAQKNDFTQINSNIMEKANCDKEGWIFNDLIGRIPVDFIIILLDLNQINDNLILFSKNFIEICSKHKNNFQRLMKENNLIFVVNKSEELENQRDNIIKMIYMYFILCSKEKYRVEMDKSFENFKNTIKIFFISSQRSYESVHVTKNSREKEEEFLKKYCKNREELEKKIKIFEEKIEKNNDYIDNLDFENMIAFLSKKIDAIYNKKIVSEMNKILSFLELGQRNYLNQNSYLLDQKDFIKKNQTIINSTIKFLENSKKVKLEEILEKFSQNLKRMILKNEKLISNNYYDFISDLYSEILKNIKDIFYLLKNLVQEILELFNDLPNFKSNMESNLKFELNEIEKEIESYAELSLYEFIPNEIMYYSFWLFWRFLNFFVPEISFGKNWDSFKYLSDSKIKNIKNKINEKFGNDLLKILKIIKDSWNMCILFNKTY